MERLKEWIDKNGNKLDLSKINSTRTSNKSSSTTTSTNKSFRKKLYKLVKYYEHNNPDKYDIFVSITALSDDEIRFTVYSSSAKSKHSKLYYIISIGLNTEAWRVEIHDEDSAVIDDFCGMGWEKLIEGIKQYITVPDVGTKEYNELLTEWVNKNGNKVDLSTDTDLCEALNEWVDAKGNKIDLKKISTARQATNAIYAKTKKTTKDKFQELIDYMESHKVPYTTKTEIGYLYNTCFKYNITRKSPGTKEYVITLEVEHSKTTDMWEFTVYINGDYLDDASGSGWESLLYFLRDSEFGVFAMIPEPGSKEYDSLCESTETSLVDSVAKDFKIYENLWDNLPKLIDKNDETF